MSANTPATLALKRAKIDHILIEYDYDPDADRVGLQAAEAIGADPADVFKTLMIALDGKAVCAVVPSDREVDMKKLAKALGGKSASMIRPADAERMSGYKVGGISPLGQKKPIKTVLDESALGKASIHINGGRRGLQAKVDPQDLIDRLNIPTADITR